MRMEDPNKIHGPKDKIDTQDAATRSHLESTHEARVLYNVYQNNPILTRANK